jgi:two-component system phosphate regulon sensor histidine kinase PhoR
MAIARTLTVQLYSRFLWATLFSLLGISLIGGISVRNYFIEQVFESLTDTVYLVEPFYRPLIVDEKLDELDTILKKEALHRKTHITLLNSSGLVLADSRRPIQGMDNHLSRPEVQMALREGLGRAVRMSDSVKREMIYSAVPIYQNGYSKENGTIIAILRTSQDIEGLYEKLNSIYLSIGGIALVILLLSSLYSISYFQKLVSKIHSLLNTANAYAKGDFSARAIIREPLEIQELSQSLNQMSRQLNHRLQAITSQKSELEAILQGMQEALIMLDPELKVRKVNSKALEMFHVNESEISGRDFLELFPVIELWEYARSTLEKGESQIKEMIIGQGTPLVLQVSGNIIQDLGENPLGILMVINDITSLKHLEQIRKDFVANVSHELKTPITSIMGFVEILGTKTDLNAEKAQHFLSIINRQVKRLHHIIDDLLILSRLEQKDSEGFAMEVISPQETVESALSIFDEKIKAKRIHLKKDCQKDVKIKAHSRLFHQALTNLIDNAIKYSEDDSSVHIKVFTEADMVQIRVSDEGEGIPSSDLHRIFERFYRVDKARSRAKGGTGLGLSIVKHIAMIHGGQVKVESILGKGSSFTLSIPQYE